MKGVLITRPSPDADELAENFRRRGFIPVVDPMLKIVPHANVLPPPNTLQATIFTSANGARALAQKATGTDFFSLPVVAVGAKTAAAAKDCGFLRVEAAEGTVESLAALIQRRLVPHRGTLLHAAGREIAGDLAKALATHGFVVVRKILYAAVAAQRLAPETIRLWRAERIGAAVFFSARSAAVFTGLAERHALTNRCRRVAAYCLSPAVADALKILPFRRIRVADRPCRDDLLSTFDADFKSVANARETD